jgi:hypothetical protein
MAFEYPFATLRTYWHAMRRDLGLNVLPAQAGTHVTLHGQAGSGVHPAYARMEIQRVIFRLACHA